jgi:subtilisin family serine protease
MKSTSRFINSNSVLARFSITAFSAPLLAALALTMPLAGHAAPGARAAGAAKKTSANDAALPPSRQKAVAIMVEMSAAPAAVSYAAALKTAQAQFDTQRSYALAHPRSRSSKRVLATTSVQISSSAAKQVANNVRQLDRAQKAMLPALTGGNINGRVLFRAQRVYNGIAMVVSPDKISQIAAMPGVKAVHPMHPKFLTAAFSDIDFLGGRSFWTKPPFGIHGENIKVADIDTGLDYIHTNFGGPGSSGYSVVTDHSSPASAPNAYFPTPKVPGGYDFAGDGYDADFNDLAHAPMPDPDPFDCNGHGTGTASLIAGYGVTNAGFTYSGSYDASNPMMSSLSISPGFAPNAKLYPLRVFGCAGSTNLVVEALEWAMDPNGDGNFSDHMDVVNMSLGANDGYADDPDDVAASNAASIGVIVCSAAGNAGDTYYVHSSPAAASGTLSCAATYNDQNGFIYNSNVTANAPAGIAGQQYFSIYGTDSPHVGGGGLTGDLVYGVPNNASTAFTNAADISGKICLIDRGATSFTDMITKAFNAGAVGVVVNNFNHPADAPILMSTPGQPAIPAVMISRTDRDTINTAAGGFDGTTGEPTNATNITINNDAGTFIQAANGPGAPAAPGSPDTVPSYTSRGPRLPDSALKPDVAAPAEVTGVAVNNSGNGFMNFNGTSSATPHVAGTMALLRQLHPTWTVQELNALACNTATHNLATTVGGSTLIGVGRIGAGRLDLTNASSVNSLAFNGTDPNLIGVSFGDVEVPVPGSVTLTKSIKVENKGAANESYSITYEDITSAAGTNFNLPASVNVAANSSNTFNVTFSANGNALRHDRDLSTGTSQATGFGTLPRQYLTEKAGYAVLTPTINPGPAIRVALYAAPKPISTMHATMTGIVPTAASGSFTINLSGSGINTGASFPTDIVSLVKGFELQYASPLAGSPAASTNPDVLKYVGVTSDWANRSSTEHDNFATWLNFAIVGFGNAPVPDFNSADKEIFMDLDFDNVYDVAIFLTQVPNGTSPTNVYFSVLVDLTGVFGPPGNAYYWEPTNILTNQDLNAFNNSVVTVPLDELVGTGYSAFQYQVVTFDRNGNEVDETPVLYFDAANPGLDATPAATLEPFFLPDLPATTIPVNYVGTNFQTNGSLGVLVVHMHNGTGNHSDVVAFRKPTITGFSPASGKVGALITITGSNFNAGTVVRFFNNKTASINVLTSNTLIATVPAGAITGPIRVSNAAGSSSRPGFTVLP